MNADEKATSAFAAPPPDPELERLAPLLGRWRAEDMTEDGVAGPAVRVISDERFYWLEGGYFLVQPYETTFGDEPAQKGINYWYYDSLAKKFRIIFFSNNGPYTEDGNRYGGEIGDGRLTFEGPARFQYELDGGRIKTNADGGLTVAWWLRDQDGHWKSWMTNSFTRVTQ